MPVGRPCPDLLTPLHILMTRVWNTGKPSNGAAAAAAGGFTTVMVVPNTKPVIDTKSAVEYIVAKNTQLPARVLPLGAVTRQTDGKELAEMYDMFANGAIAFSDGIQPIQSAGLLVKALQYIKAIDAVLIQVPDDTSIAPRMIPASRPMD